LVVLCEEAGGYEKVIAVDKELSHYFPFAAEVLEVLFSTQVIKKNSTGCFTTWSNFFVGRCLYLSVLHDFTD